MSKLWISKVNMNSTSVLDSLGIAGRINDIYTIMISPLILCFGLVSSLINTAIFMNPKLKDKTYAYLSIHSAVETAYIFQILILEIRYCDSLCELSISQSYFSVFIEQYSDLFLTSSLALFNIMIEIILSLLRLFVISNKSYCSALKNSSIYFISVVCLLVALLIHSNDIIFLKIVPEFGNATIYELVLTVDEESKWANVYHILDSEGFAIRGPVCFAILVTVNWYTLIRFRRHLTKKQKISNGITAQTALL